VAEPFYLGKLEVTREQYNRFDPSHDNGTLDQRHKDHTTPGYPANGPGMPVIRVSWEQAAAFCRWMAERTRIPCTLPTETEWEWACRAGRSTEFHFGGLDDDFAPFANLADLSVKRLAVTGVNPTPIANPNQYQDYLPKEERFDDGKRLMCEAGLFEPNPWGLCDMHGNVWEWTLSDHLDVPAGAIRPDGGRKTVRGGSWRDRPRRATAAFRLGYRPYQRVFNVGFRVKIAPSEPHEERH